jgi:predicted transcriptional regulator
VENEHYAFVLVADEKYWNRLSQGSQQGKQIHFFVRKSQVGPTEAKKLLFYVKKPRMQILGTADFAERITGDAEELWNMHGSESFFESFDEYKAFAEGRKKMTFIRFQNFLEIANPKPKETVTRVLGSLVWLKPRYVSQQSADMLTV